MRGPRRGPGAPASRLLLQPQSLHVRVGVRPKGGAQPPDPPVDEPGPRRGEEARERLVRAEDLREAGVQAVLFLRVRCGRESVDEVEHLVVPIADRVPLPEVASFEELNAYLRSQCLADEARTVQGQSVCIRDAWQEEKACLLPLPEQEYACCKTQQVSLTPYSQVVFETNRYSVPVGAGRRVLTLRAYTFCIEILHQGQVLATHERCYGHGQDIFDPLHYLPLLQQRPGAFDYAKPLRQWRSDWPPVYEQVLAELRSLWPDGRGIREFVQILQLHKDYPPHRIEQALSAALDFGCVHYEGVRLCLNQLLLPKQLPLPLDLEGTPLSQLQPSGAQPVDLQAYDQLIGGV